MPAPYSFSEMLGPTLLTKSGENPTATLDGKTVLIYFSAHWCPPCRGFTPKLSEFYTKLKGTRDDFECVFVSSDRDEGAFEEYYGGMPFAALPYADRKKKEELSKRFKVGGIPTLVVVGSDGEVVTKDGRSEVMADMDGSKFPWVPPRFEDVFPPKLLGKSGDVDAASLDDKYLMLYFSAHWCPPCRGFTPQLAEVYKKLKETRDDFDLVFVSSDKDEDAFNEYYGSQPWLALPYGLRDSKESLSKIFEVEGIPTLVVLGPKGPDGKREVINAGARGEASLDNISSFPWYPKPYADLSKTAECNGSDINESPALVVLCEAGDDDEQKEVKEAVAAAAGKRAAGSDLLFFYGCESGGPVPRVRELCGLDKNMDTVMILLDIPDNGGYYVSSETDVTVESIEAFIKDRGERRQLG